MPNPLCHFEIITKDPERSKAFYGELFDWVLDDHSMPGYTLINAGAEPTGGMMQMPPNAPGACMNVYFHVDDVPGTLAQAEKLGAKVLVGVTKIPNVGEFAIITDPEGIPFGLFKSASV